MAHSRSLAELIGENRAAGAGGLTGAAGLSTSQGQGGGASGGTGGTGGGLGSEITKAAVQGGLEAAEAGTSISEGAKEGALSVLGDDDSSIFSKAIKAFLGGS